MQYVTCNNQCNINPLNNNKPQFNIFISAKVNLNHPNPERTVDKSDQNSVSNTFNLIAMPCNKKL